MIVNVIHDGQDCCMVRFTKALMSLLGQLWEEFAQRPIQNMIVYIMHIWLHVFTCARGFGHETMLNPKTDPTDQGGPVYDRTSELGITSFSCSIFTACTLSSSNQWEERSHEDVFYTPAYQGRLPGLETFDSSLNLQ